MVSNSHRDDSNDYRSIDRTNQGIFDYFDILHTDDVHTSSLVGATQRGGLIPPFAFCHGM